MSDNTMIKKYEEMIRSMSVDGLKSLIYDKLPPFAKAIEDTQRDVYGNYINLVLPRNGKRDPISDVNHVVVKLANLYTDTLLHKVPDQQCENWGQFCEAIYFSVAENAADTFEQMLVCGDKCDGFGIKQALDNSVDLYDIRRDSSLKAKELTISMKNINYKRLARDFYELCLDAIMPRFHLAVPNHIICNQKNKWFFENIQAVDQGLFYKEETSGVQKFYLREYDLPCQMVSFSKHCPDNEIYAINTSTFKFHSLCDWNWIEGEDGKIVRGSNLKDYYRATFVKYGNLICEAPQYNAKITLED